MLFYQLLLSFFLMILCSATYDWRDGQLPLERLHVVQSGGAVKNSETKTDHHVPTSANFPRQNFYHYRTK